MGVEEGIVERVVAGGAGLIRREAGVCFVRGVLPGERIRFRLLGRTRGALEGELLELLEQSPERVTPPCHYYHRCGGCEFQEIGYREQLRIKKAIVQEQLRRIGGLRGHPVRDIRAGEPYKYRSRVRLHRSEEGRFGFRERAGRNVVAVDRCIVSREEINREITSIQRFPPSADAVSLALSDHGVLRSDGACEGRVSLLGIEVHFSGAGFFQGNLRLFEELLRELVEELETFLVHGGDSRTEGEGSATSGGAEHRTALREYELYDLYAGTGVIATVVAGALERRRGLRPGVVHAVEPDRRASGFLEKNLSEYSSKSYPSPLEEALSTLPAPTERSIVVVDPPRAGLSSSVRSFLLRRRPGLLAYISCDPGTLARDLKALSDVYQLGDARPYDFFPQTSHVETLITLRPKGRL